MAAKIKLIECPRDAMQGWKNFIPTAEKINYLQSLLDVGFDTIDAGSFVSHKAIPQMADTAEVFSAIDLSGSSTRLLAIVANDRGAKEAAAFEVVTFIGFPFSISETFQLRNTNSTISESYNRLQDIAATCAKTGKQLVVYLSMGFGNPYNDPYSPEIVSGWAEKIGELGVKIISLADTVGLATPGQVFESTSTLIRSMPSVQIGVHLHSSPYNWQQKLEAAVRAGCTRIDGALKGIGGCPMAGDDLVGNMDMENMIGWLQQQGLADGINQDALQKSLAMADKIFSH
ncbi:MAG: hydroxymethylglutaryl-CoA lyase [Chitinophagaceae bacterium]|nr:MAG: hydroxymethylglutaryl-CoA lyase [Chitinophagaceae bacterium]